MTVAIWVYVAGAIATAVCLALNYKRLLGDTPKGWKGIMGFFGVTATIIISALWPAYWISLFLVHRKVKKLEKK